MITVLAPARLYADTKYTVCQHLEEQASSAVPECDLQNASLVQIPYNSCAELRYRQAILLRNEDNRVKQRRQPRVDQPKPNT